MASPPVADKTIEITHRLGQGGALVLLSGVIDEKLDRKKLIGRASGVVVFDLDGVRRITSFGVREWLEALKELKSSYYCFVHCRPGIVAQFNMVSRFGGTGELLSLYAPYLCPACNTEHEVLVDLRTQHSVVKTFGLAKVRCPTCAAEMEFDDIPESYFAHVAQAPQPRPPALVEALLSGSASPALPGFRVDKQVEGRVTALWFSGRLDRAVRMKRLGDGLEGQVVALCEGVPEVTDEGLAQLGSFLDAAEVDVHLARMGPGLLAALVRKPESAARGVLVSARLPFGCSKCHALVERDLDLQGLKGLASGATANPRCLECGGAVLLAADEALVRHLEAMPWRLAPVEISEYLARHPVAPPKAAAVAPPPPSFELGPDDMTPSGQVFGRYHLLRLLGSGGMAEVFLARQTSVGGFEKKIVVKRILPHLSADAQFISMFLQEARLSARISHPNVVQVFDVGQVGTRYFMALEYVKGWDLNAILRLSARLNVQIPVSIAVRIVADVCAGLHAAHSCHDDEGHLLAIVHRDVSPHNILISGEGQAKLTDFGIAKAMDSGSLTPTEALKGKLSYMAPEQVRNDLAHIGPQVDIFASGLILYQALTLEHLFRRESDLSTLKAILHDPVPRLSARRPEVRPLLEEILDRALARSVAERYPTARAFQQDLEKYLAENAPAGAGEVAAWLASLIERAKVEGQLPPEMSFTPTSQGPDRTDATLATPNLRSGTGTPRPG